MAGPITFTFEELIARKEAGVPEAALKKLRETANGIMAEGIISVTQRTLHSPKGTLNDYMSMGPYWWPNPNTPDGLPYVNHDGLYNPETIQKITPSRLNSNIENLAIATFYFGEDKYAEFAERQLRAWFLDAETKMNPHAKFAQAIPGICEGRGVGLIDFGGAYHLFNGIGILESMGKISEDTLCGVKAWYTEFVNWILTNESGYGASCAPNNHGAWYDAHILAAALATDRPTLAKKICDTSYDIRIKRMIEPDGSQPHELRRTQPIGYSLYALDAMLTVANIATARGYTKYWSVDAERGVCILKSAIDFLYPIEKYPETNPYKSINADPSKPKVPGDVRYTKMLLTLHHYFPNDGYDKLAADFNNFDDRIECLLPIK